MYEMFVIIGDKEYQVVSTNNNNRFYNSSDVEEAKAFFDGRRIDWLETINGDVVIIPKDVEYHIVFRKFCK